MDDVHQLNRREYDRQFQSIEKKLESHGEALEAIKETMATLAVQNYQIQSLQSQCNEQRGDINEIYTKFEKISTWQASCPRKSISSMWGVIISGYLILIGTFVAHIFSGATK